MNISKTVRDIKNVGKQTPPPQKKQISSGGIAWPFSGPKGPKIGTEGAVLENFGKFSKKVA